MKEEYESPKIERTEENQPFRRFSPNVVAWAIVGILIFLGLGVYLAIHSYQNWKEDQTVTVEKIEKTTDPREMNYDDYVAQFRDSGIEGPIESYVQNVKIPEEGREEVDPMYTDPYIGYSENRDIHAALWSVDDGNLLFLYEPNSKEIVSINQWRDDYEDALALDKLRGEKAVLTLETIEEENPEVKKENLREIERMNQELLEIMKRINDNLDHQ